MRLSFRWGLPETNWAAKYRHRQSRRSAPATINPPNPTHGAIAMAEKIIRFIEELVDAFNFGSSINK
ncbi:hypothetical protein [Achromobacter kerstersii]